MIVYNVTIKIDPDVHEDWLTWMREVHIPDVMETGLFQHNRIYRVLGKDESDGVTYSIQYTCADMKTLHMYQVKYAPALQKEHTQRYDGKFVAFRTLLEELDPVPFDKSDRH